MLSAALCGVSASASSYRLGDMNGDGAVNSNDAIYLLRHTLQQSQYPLVSPCEHDLEIEEEIATCQKAGYRKETCKLCGVTVVNITYPQKDCVPKAPATCTKASVCATCGQQLKAVTGIHAWGTPVVAFYGCSSFVLVYYDGTASEWKNVSGNEHVSAQKLCYYSAEEPPDTEAQYWHYVDSVPTPW